MALQTFEKQPAELLDYDADFVDWLANEADTIAGHTVTVPTGITLENSGVVSGVVKVWLSGGTSGATYKITVRITTTAGRVKEYDFNLLVKEQ